YDQVNNEQREIIYGERRKVLNGENMRNSILKMIMEVVEGCVDTCISEDQLPEEWDMTELNNLLLPIVPMNTITLSDEDIKHLTKKELMQRLKEEAVRMYEAKEAEFPEAEQLREVERVILLKVIDHKWMDHIDDMDQLRQGIGLQAYGQKNPLSEYKMMGYDMFSDMEAAIAEDTVKALMHVRIEQKVEREEVAKVTGTNRDDTVANAPVKRQAKKIMPNDPCPCGSGRKYKQCCGRS
ncbi:MAG: SEC-C domain-containing protein, partial [Lachnospiraceae bacterium]|nr:SEC-C domain-containing protein [Lachnospiraceae bacterium]